MQEQGAKEKNGHPEPSEEKTEKNKTDIIEADADKIIMKHVYVSLGVGLIPIPFLDFVGVSGVQLNMMRKLAQIYNIPFSKDMVKNLIGALIGGAFPASAGPLIASSFAKMVPGIGHALGLVGASGISGACTYAIGKVFSRHFAEGGTFLSFDPENAREFYEEMFREGRDMVSEIKNRKTK
ncbi:MAG: DUF697 domain-containing protein [Desulfococcaceae bacterium]|jgi:uncharacterized protein (DUF697 family)|nr:DUF697 domain-containing protein [Desulfococcaceae bacterium]